MFLCSLIDFHCNVRQYNFNAHLYLAFNDCSDKNSSVCKSVDTNFPTPTNDDILPLPLLYLMGYPTRDFSYQVYMMQQIYFCIHQYAVSSSMTLQTPLSNIHRLEIFQMRPADLLYGDVVGEFLAYCSDCSIYSTGYIGIFLIMDRKVLPEVILSFEWFLTDLTRYTYFALCVSPGQQGATGCVSFSMTNEVACCHDLFL